MRVVFLFYEEDTIIENTDQDPFFDYASRFSLGDPDSFGVSGDLNIVDLEHVKKFTGNKIKKVNEDMEVNSIDGYCMINQIIYQEKAARDAEFPSNGNEYSLSPMNYIEIPNGTILHVEKGITIDAEHIWGTQAAGKTVTLYKVSGDDSEGYVLQDAFNGSPTNVNPENYDPLD